MKKYLKNKILSFTILFIFVFSNCVNSSQKTKELKEEKKELNTKIEKIQEIKKEFQEGDIIFQISLSGQGKALKLATKSNYTHCGIIFVMKNEFFVYEAIQPVQFTPLKTWIDRGDGGHFVVKRLKNSTKILTKNILEKMKENGNKMKGKNYDIHFGWSDDKIYCSELVWKIYKSATNIEVGKIQKLKDFDLTSQEVKQKMKERYGNYFPLEENVISPISIFKSDKLEEVMVDYPKK
ncbi:MAG: YiiX family permuted papain-like enzyme [Bacteroidetes bacterium]|nr:MAG: YiiX family permuted papain-like enzyme [Bacteroidota bacterium]